MKVLVKIDKNWDTKQLANLDIGLLELTLDIDKRSKMLAPVQTGALVNSAKIARALGGYSITYGNDRVPYARRQFFENKTKSRYLTRAADAIVRGSLTRYFGNK